MSLPFCFPLFCVQDDFLSTVGDNVHSTHALPIKLLQDVVWKGNQISSPIQTNKSTMSDISLPHVLAGTVAGASEAFVAHPLDTYKVRRGSCIDDVSYRHLFARDYTCSRALCFFILRTYTYARSRLAIKMCRLLNSTNCSSLASLLCSSHANHTL